MITHARTKGDTLTPLAVALYQRDSEGADQRVNLSGKTVKFKMVDAAGTSKIAETATGVTVTSAALGEVQYDFLAAGVDTAGRYYGWFTVFDGTETDTFPCDGRTLVIVIAPDE